MLFIAARAVSFTKFEGCSNVFDGLRCLVQSQSILLMYDVSDVSS